MQEPYFLYFEYSVRKLWSASIKTYYSVEPSVTTALRIDELRYYGSLRFMVVWPTSLIHFVTLTVIKK
jgi:hypothetical protein